MGQLQRFGQSRRLFQYRGFDLLDVRTMTEVFTIIGIFVTSVIILNYLLSLAGRYGKLDVPQRLGFYIDAYMRGGFHKTCWKIRDPNTGKHVWFVKLTTAQYGFEFGLTRFFMRLSSDSCSVDEFKRAQEILKEAGIDYYLTTERDPTPQALVVHCDMDVEKAVRAARCILVNVFGLADDSPLRYGHYGPAEPSPDAIVGWEDSPQLEQYLKARAAAGKPVPKRYRHLVGPPEE